MTSTTTTTSNKTRWISTTKTTTTTSKQRSCYLKYLNNFSRSLDLPLINCEAQLELLSIKYCFVRG